MVRSGSHLPVPAEADFCLVGTIDPERLLPEGPFGEWMDYYVPVTDNHVIMARRVVARRDAVFHAILSGTSEEIALSSIPNAAMIYRAVRAFDPYVRDVVCFPHMQFVVVQIEKRYEGQAAKVMLGAFGAETNRQLYCVVVDEDVRERAFAALEALYEEVEAFVEKARPVCIQRGVCCRFEEAGHELYSTALEADYAAARAPEGHAPAQDGRCPYHVEGKCTARSARALGCRTYYCDVNTEGVLAEAHEHFLGRLREIERETGYPAAYGRFPALLQARGVGVEAGS